MLELAGLTLPRQRRVAQALTDAANDKALTKSLHADVRAALTRAAAAGDALAAAREFPPLVLDNTTDSVFAAFDDLLEAVEQGLTDRVIRPLTEEQARKKAAATTLRQRVFAGASSFLTLSMPLQYRAMSEAVRVLTGERDCVAATKELGLGWLVEHLVAHLGPYGRAVMTADGRDFEAGSDAFHGALTELALQVAVHQRGDGEAQKRLFGAYESELAAQRDEEREARRRAKKKKPAEG